jgi:hypothetical protein
VFSVNYVVQCQRALAVVQTSSAPFVSFCATRAVRLSESANICVHLRLKLLVLIRSSLFVFSEPYLAWDGKIFEPRIAQTALIFRVWILIDQHDFVSDRFVRFCEF